MLQALQSQQCDRSQWVYSAACRSCYGTCRHCALTLCMFVGQALFKRSNSNSGTASPMSVASDGHGPLADLKAEDRSTLHQVHALACYVTGPGPPVSVLASKHGNVSDALIQSPVPSNFFLDHASINKQQTCWPWLAIWLHSGPASTACHP